ncbi:MAG: hypothetical protein AAGA32_06950 [Pseudomonadota bacterium]
MTARLKDDLLRDCDAMIRHAASQGATIDPEDIVRLQILDGDEAMRAETPLDEVLALHAALTAAVAPATPNLVRRLYEEGIQPRSHYAGKWYGWIERVFHGFAPLNSLRVLMVVAVSAGLLFLLLPLITGYFNEVLDAMIYDCALSAAPEEADHQKCPDWDANLLARLLFVYALLGTLGAIYSSVYDSFSYLREGRYDQRLASTYYVRILLGAFAGVLLAYPLASYLEGNAVSAGLLAFLGGFAAQLVYKLLMKLVDAVESMFRPERRREMAAIRRAAEVQSRESAQAADAKRRAALANAVETSETIADPIARAAWLRSALLAATTGSQMPAQPDTPTTAAPSDDVAALLARLAVAEAALTLRPGPVDPAAAAALSAAAADLDAAATAAAADPTPATRQSLARAKRAAEAADPLPDWIAPDLAALAAVVGSEGGRTLGATAVIAGARFTGAAQARWGVVALGADREAAMPALADEPEEALFGAAEAVGLGSAVASVFASPEEVEDLRRLLRNGGAAEIAALLTPALSGLDPEAAVSRWLSAAIRGDLARDLEAELAKWTDPKVSPDAALTALDAALNTPAAAGGIQSLTFLGQGVAAAGASDVRLPAVLAALDEASAPGAGQ